MITAARRRASTRAALVAAVLALAATPAAWAAPSDGAEEQPRPGARADADEASDVVLDQQTRTLVTGDVVRRATLADGSERFAASPPAGSDDARYSGYVDASGDTHLVPVRVQSQVGAQYDAELFNVSALFRGTPAPAPAARENPDADTFELTLELTDTEGGADFEGYVAVVEVEEAAYRQIQLVAGEPSVTLDVPAGTYGITFQTAQGYEPTRLVNVSVPDVEVDRDLTLQLDGRTATRVPITIPDADAAEIGTGLAVSRQPASGLGFSIYHDYGVPGVELWAAPTDAAATGTFDVDLTTSRLGADLYQLAYTERDGIPADLAYDVSYDDLAAVDLELHGDVSSARYSLLPVVVGWVTFFGAVPIDLRATDTLRAWVSADDAGYLHVIGHRGGFGVGELQDAGVGLPAGSTTVERWFAHPSRPGAPAGWPMAWTGDTLDVELYLMDAGGHHGFVDPGFEEPSVDEVRLKLTSDGEAIASADELVLGAELPAGRHAYELSLDTARTADWATMSTSTSTTWDFEHERVGGDRVPLPLLQVDTTLDLDLLNRVVTPTTITFSPYATGGDAGAGAGPTEITSFEAAWSVDDGATWVPLELTGGDDGSYDGTFTAPEGCAEPCLVSLRTSARADGSLGPHGVEQTITRAFTAVAGEVPPTTGPPTTPPPTTPTVEPTLPPTGASSTSVLAAGLGLVLLGASAIVLAAHHRLREHPASRV